MSALEKPELDKKAILFKAYMNMGEKLKFNQSELGQIIGRDRPSMRRSGEIDPDSKVGESALLMLRCYRGAKALMQTEENVQHWFDTKNHAFGIAPREMVKSTEGLVTVVQYLDAYRGKN